MSAGFTPPVPPGPPAPAQGDPGRGSWAFPGTEAINPAEVFAGPGYTSPRPPASVLARVAVVAAVFGFIPGVSVIACVTGHLALREIERSPRSGRGLALAGLTIGYIQVVLWLLFAAVWATTS